MIINPLLGQFEPVFLRLLTGFRSVYARERRHSIALSPARPDGRLTEKKSRSVTVQNMTLDEVYDRIVRALKEG